MQIVVSSISLAEIVYLTEKKRLPHNAYNDMKAALADPEHVFREAFLTVEVVEAMRRMSRDQVPDMPDRIVAATSVYFGVPVISRDGRIRGSAYKPSGNSLPVKSNHGAVALHAPVSRHLRQRVPRGAAGHSRKCALVLCRRRQASRDPGGRRGTGSSGLAESPTGHSELTEVCSYDRIAGHCCEEVVDDLHALLDSLPGPYVLVGHSLGGLYVRRFAARFPDDVAGLVLIDASDEKQLTGILAPGVPPQLWRPGAMSDSELQKFFEDLGRRMRASQDAPAKDAPHKADDGASGEIRMAQFYRQIAAERRDFMFSDKPLIVLTATRTAPMPRFSENQVKQLTEDYRVLQERMQLLSRNSKQILVDSGHFVHRDRPDVVIAAIREVVTAVRSGSRLAPEHD